MYATVAVDFRGLAKVRYLWAQWRHTRAKATKNPAFRIGPAIELMKWSCPWLGPGSRVLDVGPRNLFEVELLEAAGWTVEALDLFPTSPRIRRGDMHRLPYAADSFEAAFCSHVLEHAFDLRAACREITRVLVPEGVVWIAGPRGFTPTAHDRWPLESPEMFLEAFREAKPELLWHETKPGELRALMRLWKEPAQRVAVILLPGALHIRAWVGSGLVGMLRDRGWRPHLLVPRRLLTGIAALTDGISSEAMEPYAGGRFRRWLRRGPLRTASYVARARAGSWTYRHKLSRRWETGRPRSVWAWADVAFWRVLGLLADPEHVAAWIERSWRPSKAARRLLEALRPAVVVASTTIHEGLEMDLFKSARRAGIPTVAEVAGIDTLVSKGAFLVTPDRLLVWGGQSAGDAVADHGFSPHQVTVTGPPHADLMPLQRTRRPSRLIFVQGTTLTYWREESAIVGQLAAWIHDGTLDASVWYRPHARRPCGQVEAPPGVVILDPGWLRQADRGGGFPINPEALHDFWRVLAGAACVVTAWSTVIVEAALLGIPSVVVGYGEGVPAFGRWAHLEPVLRWPGVFVAESPRDLRRLVSWALDGTFNDMANDLRREADHVARALDRGARGRVVAALDVIAEEARCGTSSQ